MSECAVKAPIVGAATTEPADPNKPCINSKHFSVLKDIAKKEKIASDSVIDSSDYAGIVAIFLDYLKLQNERDIWVHHLIHKYIGSATSNAIKLVHYKVPGPAGTNALLNNFNIDAVTKGYELKSPTLFKKRFKALGFEMIDFAKNPRSALMNFPFDTKDWDCVGIVLNSDVSSGPGKHWFTLYVELGGPVLNIEYFNSSSRLPYEEIIEFYNYLKGKYPKLEVRLNTVVKQRIQESKTECGMFSIIYIIGRLEGKPPEFFAKNNVTDDDMYRYRRIIFKE